MEKAAHTDQGSVKTERSQAAGVTVACPVKQGQRGKLTTVQGSGLARPLQSRVHFFSLV